MITASKIAAALGVPEETVTRQPFERYKEDVDTAMKQLKDQISWLSQRLAKLENTADG